MHSNIAEVERAGDRIFLAELDQHLEREAQGGLLVESIEEYAEHLMMPGEQCDPWTFEHVLEALVQATDDDQRRPLPALVDTQVPDLLALTQAPEAYQRLFIAVLVDVQEDAWLKQLVTDYWAGMAAYKANEEYTI